MTNYLFRLEVPEDKSAFTVAEVLAATAVAIHGSAGPLQGKTDSMKLPPSLKRKAASQVHREVLIKAISDGAIVLRSPLTGTECELGRPADDGYRLMTRGHFKVLCELLSIELVSPPRPHFVTIARPLEVPPELLALAPDVLISFRHEFRPNLETNAYTAADYRADIEARITRQAEGYFTLNEAAQVLANARAGMKPVEAIKRIRLAHSKGLLPIHQAETRFPLEVGEDISEWRDLLEVSELDAWLRGSAGYGFPAATGATQGLDRDVSETPKQRRARLLAMLDAEIAAGRERGALARITQAEKRTRPTADRSNIGKDIKKAREERDDMRRGGALGRLLN